jgi:hypothetical protein
MSSLRGYPDRWQPKCSSSKCVGVLPWYCTYSRAAERVPKEFIERFEMINVVGSFVSVVFRKWGGGG